MRYLGFVAVSALLGACGGGSSGGGSSPNTDVIGTTRAPTGSYTELTSSAAASSTLTVIGHDNSGNGSTGTAGTLDHATGTITGGSFAGTINGARTQITLSGAGTITLASLDGADYARTFQAATLGPLFGVVGRTTDSLDMPATSDATTTYIGGTNVTIIDDLDTYDLSGRSTITADWSAGLVDVELSDLDGSRTNGGTTFAASNVAVVRIDNAALIGNGFSGGAPSVSGAISITPSASATESQGNFFGPGADEVGGVLLIDDTSAGSTRVLGIYLAD